MDIQTDFTSAQSTEKHGFTVLSGKLNIKILYKGEEINLSWSRRWMLATMLRNPETGVNVKDYSNFQGHPSLPPELWGAYSDTLKVQIYNLRKTLKEVCDEPTPVITPLYARHDKIHLNNPDEDKQGYVLTPGIVGKPDFATVNAQCPDVSSRGRWDIYVDVASLSDNPADLRVYKRKIHDWRDGLVFAGDKFIRLSPLKTAVVADVLTETGTPDMPPKPSTSHDFSVAILGATPDAKNSYGKMLAQAAKEIACAAGRPDIAHRLLSRGDGLHASLRAFRI